MGRFMKGDIVVAHFPYSDLTATKKRPAFVVAPLPGDDVILCQITSQAVRDDYAVRLAADDFESGGLRKTSNIRPNRLFTAEESVISYRAGAVKIAKTREVIAKIIEIIQ